MAIAGRVAIVPQNEYDIETVYKRLDMVRYGKAVYVARKESVGIEPPNDEYWMLSMESGSDSAEEVTYDNTTSGLEATTVQSAIDEIATAPKVPEGVTYINFDETGEEEVEIIPTDADTLGGNPPEYFATAQSVTDIIEGTQSVGNAEKVNGITLYKSFTEIDSSFSNQTPLLDVIKGMAQYSQLTVTIYGGSTAIYPNSNGVLEIIKDHIYNYVVATFTEKKAANPQRYYLIAQPANNDITGWLGFLPLTGGTLSGNVTIEGTNSSSAALWISRIYEEVLHKLMLYMNNDGGVTLGLQIDGEWISRFIMNPDGSIGRYNGKIYNFFDESNKPAGTYTGNGDATARTIDTGGIGSVCCVYGGGNYGIVTVNGGFFSSYNSTSVSAILQAECKFVEGVLTIASTNAMINASGQSYGYQVL